MRFGSVCSGIEAASIAWNPLGWEAEFFSEIEPFPCAVLKHHHPTVPNYGDLNAFKDWPDANLDLLVGGTPCQSFSVAGLRGGMADPRGNLALVYLALASRYRPRWIVWENVPGVLSSSGGRDFGAFLGGLAELGYGWAYRILDAQFFGVPQRRRRVFVVGYLGDWRRAAAVLFEPASLRGDSPPSREARERIANALTERPDRGGGNSEGQRLVAPTISARTRGGGGLGTDFDCDGGLIGPNVSPALKARDYKGPSSDGDGDGAPLIVAHSLRADGFDASEDGTGRGTPLIAATLRGGGSTPASHGKRSGTDRDTLVFDTTQITHPENRCKPQPGDPSHPLASGARPPAVASSSVRRLTPRECERLQGFPLVWETVRMEICSDRRSRSASVALQCHKLPASASLVGGEESPLFAQSAEMSSLIAQGGSEPLAALVVRTSSEDTLLELRNRARLLWSASGAGLSGQFLRPTQAAAIARALAPLGRELAQAVRTGKAGLPANIRLSIPERDGRLPANPFGVEIVGFAEGVDADPKKDRFTTLDLGRLTPTTGSALEILCCSAMAAIGGSIPRETLPENFSLSLTVGTPYTLIPYRGKPAADGPRYKALGNSMAVPVVRWIGERIAAAEAWAQDRRSAA